ncbi:DUF3545 family protein [Pseudidiomarina marina]|uniref:DUF3545 domain-containing protein n=1 Tax=Pseudidiomarina marina TaxID=502366 RepID=A0A432YFH7_9GAMM|nr:DUF3545 family protein [Pseudidiomarina marina]RUO59680.1 DUF3545 domain-containing protein [Pseudidiomarina marina]
MDHSQELKQVESKSSKKAAPRKWREIEVLKEKYRLRDELQDIDFEFDAELDELDL